MTGKLVSRDGRKFETLKKLLVQRRLILALDLHYWFAIDKLWLLNLFNDTSIRSSYLPILIKVKAIDLRALEDDKFRHQLREDMPFPPIHFCQS